MNPLRRILLVLMLIVTTTVTDGYAASSHDDGCCPEAQQMHCTACNICTTPGLVSAQRWFPPASDAEAIATIPALNPSRHTEEIWHPPKRQS